MDQRAHANCCAVITFVDVTSSVSFNSQNAGAAFGAQRVVAVGRQRQMTQYDNVSRWRRLAAPAYNLHQQHYGLSPYQPPLVSTARRWVLFGVRPAARNPLPKHLSHDLPCIRKDQYYRCRSVRAEPRQIKLEQRHGVISHRSRAQRKSRGYRAGRTGTTSERARNAQVCPGAPAPGAQIGISSITQASRKLSLITSYLPKAIHGDQALLAVGTPPVLSTTSVPSIQRQYRATPALSGWRCGSGRPVISHD